MPELPWEKWYPTNWASEPGLRLCRAATRGIWFEALNTMMLKGTFQVRGTNEELCLLLSCLPVELDMAVQQLKRNGVGEINEQNGNITITSRRRERHCKISEIRSKAGVASGNKRRTNLQQHVGTRSASTSASASASDGKGSGETQFSEAPSWDEFWEYCQSVNCGISAEWFAKDKYWAARQDNWRGKSDWRSYARRVRVWWDNDGRPMNPPKKNQLLKNQNPVIRRDATHDATKESE